VVTLTLEQANWWMVSGISLSTQSVNPRGEIRDHQPQLRQKWSMKLVTRLIILMVSHFVYRRDGGSWQNNVSVRSTVSQVLLRALYCTHTAR
jgi:hypothetical protein